MSELFSFAELNSNISFCHFPFFFARDVEIQSRKENQDTKSNDIQPMAQHQVNNANAMVRKIDGKIGRRAQLLKLVVLS